MRKITLLLAAVFVLLTFFGCTSVDQGLLQGNKESLTIGADADGGEHFVSACYSGLPRSFSELEERSVLIVRAKPVSRYSKWEGVTSTTVLEVLDVFKGETGELIELDQMNDGHVVKDNCEYIMFLTPQYPDDPENNTYCGTGAYMGLFEIDEESGTIKVSSDSLKGEELNAWMENAVKQFSGREYRIV